MRFTLSILLAIILSGCSILRPAQVPVVPAPAIKGPSPYALRATAVVEFNSDKSVKGRAYITVTSPDAFKVEILTPFGTPAAVMMSDGVTLSMLKDGKVESYPWTDDRIPYDFTSSDLVSILLGHAPFDLSNVDGWEPGGMVTVVTDTDDRGVYNVTTDIAGNVTEITKTVDGLITLTAEMSELKKIDGFVLPHRISIRDSGKTLDINYKGVEINPELKKDAFRFKKGTFQ